MLKPSGACSAKNDRWSLENSLRNGPLPETVSRTDARGTPLSECRAHVPTRSASSSTTKSGRARSSGGRSDGTTGRSLITESSPFACTRRARTTTPALLSVEIGGVEEEHLPDLGVERVDPEGGRARPV